MFALPCTNAMLSKSLPQSGLQTPPNTTTMSSDTKFLVQDSLSPQTPLQRSVPTLWCCNFRALLRSRITIRRLAQETLPPNSVLPIFKFHPTRSSEHLPPFSASSGSIPNFTHLQSINGLPRTLKRASRPPQVHPIGCARNP